MNKIVNLNQYKKAKTKADKETNAKNNRILFGTPKDMKDKAKSLNFMEQKKLAEKILKDNLLDSKTDRKADKQNESD